MNYLVPLIFLVLPAHLAQAEYSWQKTHARVLPTGNLEWSPESFQFIAGDSVRYIDFEAGNDDNPGTREQPWKHHPWDPNATGLSKACTGIHTYVFKRGVIYRGALKARESGRLGNPIRLTSDPTWGEGEAMLFGSVRLPSGWKRCREEDAPGIPDPTKVWYLDLGPDFDKDSVDTKMSAIWRLRGGEATRLHIARDPNWKISNADDPTAEWHRWQWFNGDRNVGWLGDPSRWAGKPAQFFDNAIIWTQHRHLMGTVHRVQPLQFDSEKGAFRVSSPGGAQFSRQGNTGGKEEDLMGRVRYFIENVPAFLDSPGEYYFDGKRGRLFLRLDDDGDPNEAVLEAAQIRSPIEIWDQSDIEISGLMFRFNDDDDGVYGYPWYISASPGVRIVGNCRRITVRHCKFYDVMNAVVAFPRPTGVGGPAEASIPNCGPFADDVMEDIVICDNDVRNVDMAGAIWVQGNSETRPGEKYGVLRGVTVLRNRVINSGYRPGKSPTSQIPAICVVLPETAEIAGNIVDTSWGCGIFALGGKASGAVNEVPLTRILIHHNQADNTMLGCNDYGGIELFQGGPVYIYNNVSRNCVGTKTFTGTELGYNLYLDGAFKTYCFNNILAGKLKPEDPSYYSHCGYFMVFGFLNQFFNNTLWRFEYSVNGSSGNRSCVLGNIFADASKSFLGQNRPGDASMEFGGDTGEMGRLGIPTMAYAQNIFWGKPKGGWRGGGAFGFVGGTKVGVDGQAEVYAGNTLEELREALERMRCRVSSLGQHVEELPLRDPANRDYRLIQGSAAKEAGVKFFVPWALARVVGEWNFYQSRYNPEVVLGEHFYMQEEHLERSMYYFIPRNDLIVLNTTPDDYVTGTLEDWIPGALRFDGHRVGVLPHAEMIRDVESPFAIVDGRVQRLKQGMFKIDGSRRRTLDMSTNNFLVEVVLQVNKPGVIVEKMAETGYRLQITRRGAVEFKVGADSVRAGKLTDGQWHHLIAEADREAGRLRLYLDGKRIADAACSANSIANQADFLVGRGLVGAIDFLRVARGTLADSKTTIEELYGWQFNGPHLRDFAGNSPLQRRDAGALELE
ncbi:MAG: LamG domain-containing protein [Verrucomicrobiae bacterium]|nr:LamG domain-containing protein [Verrucomicrobiae bacterium]